MNNINQNRLLYPLMLLACWSLSPGPIVSAQSGMSNQRWKLEQKGVLEFRLFPLKNLPNLKNSPPVEGCPEGGVVHHCTTPNSQYTH